MLLLFLLHVRVCVQDEIDCEGNANLLKESDFIAFFDQFPFTDLYQYILMVPMEGMSS